MDEKLTIDPAKFAETVILSQKCSGDNDEEIAKANLTLYITAYMLAEKFNRLENRAFFNKDNIEFQKIIKNIIDIGFY